MSLQAPPTPSLASWCNRLAHAALPTDYALLDAGDLSAGHPWAFLAEIALADPGSVAYYRYLYGLTRLVDPVNVLEIHGTADKTIRYNLWKKLDSKIHNALEVHSNHPMIRW